MIHDFGGEPDTPESYVWNLGPQEKTTYTLDLTTGKSTSDGELLPMGCLFHRYLVILASDFYRPFRVAPLHGDLYPDTFFPPVSGAHKIHEGVRKLRSWLKENRVPITIEEIDSQYRLHSSEGCRIILHHGRSAADAQTLLMDKIRQKWPTQDFSIQDIVGLLGISRRKAQRLMKNAIESNSVVRKGQSTQFKYHIVSQLNQKKAA